jgi:hypothetical protein
MHILHVSPQPPPIVMGSSRRCPNMGDMSRADSRVNSRAGLDAALCPPGEEAKSTDTTGSSEPMKRLRRGFLKNTTNSDRPEGRGEINIKLVRKEGIHHIAMTHDLFVNDLYKIPTELGASGLPAQPSRPWTQMILRPTPPPRARSPLGAATQAWWTSTGIRTGSAYQPHRWFQASWQLLQCQRFCFLDYDHSGLLAQRSPELIPGLLQSTI